ncbi:transporter substrate-binding domain-containing protein [Aestuariirhabdus sp. Z084]|uniref:transporter substrate-binding domain-containing diguanylate cyclase n=1 Tax=Aestuariirhabdus haliotis TaxID=2918751 RepID=UPI00201B3EBD|nr:transporter substrate-binding domain-containing protein [Aestuariirhabdus haliotis]MCL6416289.1 transporter substrate-binding domain-containing protein [Aestuariirhabdus haliotis]MCL6420162.1 transporter substrate-binding domain-containing protein [Aestuariirhabdus haliotis]
MRQLFLTFCSLFGMLCLAFSTSSKAAEIELTTEEQAYIAANPVIRVSNEMDWPPFNYNDGNIPKGYSIDFIQLVAKKVGLTVNFVSGPDWDDFMSMVPLGKLDAIMNMSSTPERRKTFSFTEPYLISIPSIITSEEVTDINNLEDLIGLTVAVPRGFDFHELLQAHYPGIHLKLTPGAKQSLEAVLFGQADATIADLAVVDYLVRENTLVGLTTRARVENEAFAATMSIGVKKSNYILRDILQKGMDKLTDSEIFAMRAKWIESTHKAPSAISKLSLEEKKYLENRDEITVCIDPDWLPYEAFDQEGQHIGMSAAFFALFSQHLATPFRVIKTAKWKDSLDKARQRECDMLSLEVKTKSRAKHFEFSKPYIVSSVVIVTKHKEPFITDIGIIGNHRIGIVKDYGMAAFVRRKYPNLNLVDVDSLREGMALVASGELFGMIDALGSTSHLITQHYNAELKISGVLDNRINFRLAIRKDDPQLLAVMNKAINRVPTETRNAISNQWLPRRVETVVDKDLLVKIFSALFVIGLFLYYRHAQLRAHNKALLELSTTDKLTGLANRAKLDDMLKLRHQEFERYQSAFSVVLIDIDKFKSINDTFGHPIGDKVLIQAAHIIRDQSRQVDCAGRWGGEEFLIICFNTDQAGAKTLAENVRCAFESSDFGIDQAVTISAGVAEIQLNGTPSTLISRADKALYEAKQNGRNRVETATKNPTLQTISNLQDLS